MTNRPSIAKSVKEMANSWRARMKDTEVGKMLTEAENEARDGNPEKLFEFFEAAKEVFSKFAARTQTEHETSTDTTI